MAASGEGTMKDRLERLERLTDRLEKTLMILEWKAKRNIVITSDDFRIAQADDILLFPDEEGLGPWKMQDGCNKWPGKS